MPEEIANVVFHHDVDDGVVFAGCHFIFGSSKQGRNVKKDSHTIHAESQSGSERTH